jgi:hypothetical protein
MHKELKNISTIELIIQLTNEQIILTDSSQK